MRIDLIISPIGYSCEPAPIIDPLCRVVENFFLGWPYSGAGLAHLSAAAAAGPRFLNKSRYVLGNGPGDHPDAPSLPSRRNMVICRLMQAKKRKIKDTTQTGNIDLTKIRHVIRALHVVPKSGGWVVTTSGAGQPSQQFSRKEDAVQFGESVAKRQKTSLIIHGRNGTIQDIDAPPADPLPPRNRNH